MSAAFSMSVDDIAEQLEPSGLTVLGVVNFDAGEGPAVEGGYSARSVLLIGNAGGSMWPRFSAWLAQHEDCDEPLDTWSRQVIAPVATRQGGTAFYPSDPPYQPFQQWAMKAIGLKPSPLGILMHPEFGLWFGFRGAIAFKDKAEGPAPKRNAHPCDSCPDKPCMTVCPVGAVTESGFSVTKCHQYLGDVAGQAGCMRSGCLARNACPVGSRHRYPDSQIRFHMQALTLPAI